MKLLIFIFSALVFVACYHPEKPTTIINKNDAQSDTNEINSDTDKQIEFSKLPPASITIVNNLVNTPFDINDENQMNYIKKIISKKSKISTEITRNIYYSNTYDTVYTIYWGKSYIQTFGNYFISNAVICDENITLALNIKIGQSFQTVCDKLKLKYQKSRLYKFIKLTTPDDDAYSDLTFYFNDNILVKVEYTPYFE